MDNPTPPIPPGRSGRRVFRVLASLQLAVVLLSLFAACLAAATLLESRYDARIAGDLVYRAWWFTLLLAMLAVNVLCAALKKYPWKRRQTGFLVTHAGLLLLLLGGVLTALFGVEGQMVLIDASTPAVQALVGLTNRADAIYLPDSYKIEVFRLERPLAGQTEALLRLVEAIDRGEEAPAAGQNCLIRSGSFPFRPGSLAWRPEEAGALQLPWELRFLQRLASPWPGTAWDLDDGTTLAVDNFYPHAEPSSTGERFVPRHVPPGGEAPSGLGPAVCCRLIRGEKKESFHVGASRRAARVLVDRDLYLVRCRPHVEAVGFRLTLNRARQTRGPGSDRPAAFQSDVSVVWPSGKTLQEHRIAMNRPLAAGSYKVYQANYRALIDPRTSEPLLDDGRPVSLSGLAVARDPGLWFKYAGSLIVVLGIATMFYMKAYFFRPRVPV